MAQKDLSSKVLESHNEIFANIFNTFVFNGNPILEPDYLQDEPTENIFLDNDGNYRDNLRDIFKSYRVKGTGAPVRLAYLGIENQSNIDKDMAVRILSYTANCYKKQCDELAIARRTLKEQLSNATTEAQKQYCYQELERYNNIKLIPTITLVLNFSKTEWTTNLSLTDKVDDSNPFKPYMQDFKIYVVNIMHLSDAEISKLVSDFKTLVSFLVKGKAPIEYLRYPIDVLMALYAYTNDVRYLAMKNNILQKLSKGGNVTMPELLDKIEYDNSVKIAKNLIALGGVSLENIAKATDLPLEIVQELAKQTVA